MKRSIYIFIAVALAWPSPVNAQEGMPRLYSIRSLENGLKSAEIKAPIFSIYARDGSGGAEALSSAKKFMGELAQVSHKNRLPIIMPHRVDMNWKGDVGMAQHDLLWLIEKNYGRLRRMQEFEGKNKRISLPQTRMSFDSKVKRAHMSVLEWPFGTITKAPIAVTDLTMHEAVAGSKAGGSLHIEMQLFKLEGGEIPTKVAQFSQEISSILQVKDPKYALTREIYADSLKFESMNLKKDFAFDASLLQHQFRRLTRGITKAIKQALRAP